MKYRGWKMSFGGDLLVFGNVHFGWQVDWASVASFFNRGHLSLCDSNPNHATGFSRGKPIFAIHQLQIIVPKSCKSYMLEPLYTPPKKLTWQWTITICNRKYIFNRLVFHRHVSFPGREWHWLSTSQNFSTFFFYTNLSLSRDIYIHLHISLRTSMATSPQKKYFILRSGGIGHWVHTSIT